VKPTRALFIGFAVLVYLGALAFALAGHGRLALYALALATSALIPNVRDLPVNRDRRGTMLGLAAASIGLGLWVGLLQTYSAAPTAGPLLVSGYLLALYNLLRGLLIIRNVLAVHRRI
jgi:hypothetical protein